MKMAKIAAQDFLFCCLGILRTLSLFAVLIGPATAHSAGVVAECTEFSLRQALAGGGEITFSCDGTITLTNSITLGSDTSIDGSGHQIAISGGNLVRLFSVSAGAHAVFKFLLLTEGAHLGANAGSGQNLTPGEMGMGGAVFNNGGDLDFFSCVLSNNMARGGRSLPLLFPLEPGEAAGGAVYSTNGQVRFYDSVVTHNLALGGGHGPSSPPVLATDSGARASGGGIYLTGGTLVLSNSQFVANQAIGTDSGPTDGPFLSGGAALGGGICVINAQASIQRCTVASNVATGGASYGGSSAAEGGGVFSDAHLKVEDSRFDRNTAINRGGPAAGGAIYSADASAVSRTAFVSNTVAGAIGTTFRGTLFPTYAFPSYGGAVYSKAIFSATNCTFFGNLAQSIWTANGEGGAIYIESGDVSMRYLTIVSNSAQRATISFDGGHISELTNNFAGSGGIKIISAGSVTIANSILSGNPQGNAVGLLTDGGYNLSSDASVVLSATGSLTNLNPKLGPMGMFGGYSEVVLLLPDSPAIDAIPAALSVATDQRGIARPFNGNADIGAFEAAEGDNLISFLSASWTSGSPVEIAFAAYPGHDGRTVVCDRTSDFKVWTPILTNSLDSDARFTIQVPSGVEAGPGFYRARITP